MDKSTRGRVKQGRSQSTDLRARPVASRRLTASGSQTRQITLRRCPHGHVTSTLLFRRRGNGRRDPDRKNQSNFGSEPPGGLFHAYHTPGQILLNRVFIQEDSQSVGAQVLRNSAWTFVVFSLLALGTLPILGCADDSRTVVEPYSRTVTAEEQANYLREAKAAEAERDRNVLGSR